MNEDITRACRDLNKLSPKGKQACELFLAECKKQGLNVLVTETYRSQARQSYLYEQGRTRPGRIVTNVEKVGYHNSGNAWDICKNVKGQEYSDNAFFSKCGAIAKTLGIEWGGYWSGFVDKPHFQISNSWQPPKTAGATISKTETVKEDEELYQACRKIILSGIKIDINKWKRTDLINLKNVPMLLVKLGGVNKLVEDKVIGNKEIWLTAQYNAKHVRALLIKYSKMLG